MMEIAEERVKQLEGISKHKRASTAREEWVVCEWISAVRRPCAFVLGLLHRRRPHTVLVVELWQTVAQL